MKKQLQRGFTLIEVLIVIGILAVLAGLVLVAINPARQFAQARDTQRQSDVQTILNAIGQRMSDNQGVFAGGGCTAISTGTTSINASGGGASDFATNCLVPTYVAAMPFDPSSTSTVTTGYQVSANASGRITVCAPLAANETAISQPPPAVCAMR